MNEKTAHIPERIKELREILEISVIDMAKDMGISYEVYCKYETESWIYRSAFYTQ